MKHHHRIVLALLALLCLFPVACGSQTRALVRVDGQEITQEDLRRELILQQGARMLLQMIDTTLINQAAAEKDLSISEGELDVKYEQAVARIGSEKDLEEKLKETRRAKQEYREELRAEALLDRLATATYPVSENDMRRYYDTRKHEFSHGEQVRMRLMLFTTRANADAVAAALADPGADFAGLATAFSEDPATKDKGGDTGFVEREDYANAISDRAFAMKPGEVSGIFEVPDGFAIIKVEERKPAGAEPFEQVKETVEARVALEQLERGRRDWLETARSRAQITIADKDLEGRVRRLMEAGTPFEPSNLAPGIPMAPR